MRVRRLISVTICAELTQSLNPQQAAPPEAARLWSFALVMLLLWAVRHRVPRRLVRGSRAMDLSGHLGAGSWTRASAKSWCLGCG